jgi:Holliday junction resolvasome RuvABC DNA-binding subunit
MSWLDWLLRRGDTLEVESSLDVQQILDAEMLNSRAAQRAIAELNSERKQLVRTKRIVEGQLKPVTKRSIRSMHNSSLFSPGLESAQLSQAMRAASDTSQEMTLRREQLADINGRILAIDQAKERLKGDRR